MPRWHLTLLVVTAIVIAGLAAYGLRTFPLRQTAPAFTVTRQQAVIAVLESANRAGVMTLPVGAEKRPDGLNGIKGPVWLILVDLFPLGSDGPWERRGCLVDGRTAELRSCSGGSLPYIPQD